MPASLDLRKAHLTRQHGDLLAVYTWINDERAMVLIPHRRPGAPWYVVMDSAAHTWDDEDASRVPLVAAKAAKACEVLGIEPSPWACRRVAGIIIDGLPDLIRMPSAPPPEHYQPSFGQMQVRADGKVIGGEDIKIEREGVQYA